MKYSLLLISLLFSILCSGQPNLVLNPGFEDTLHLIPFKNYEAIYPLCKYWVNPNAGTSDYFSSFADDLEWQTTNVGYYSVGDNPISNSLPHTGNGMIGGLLYEYESNSREFCMGRLSEELLPGVEYCLGLWVRRGENSGYTSCQLSIGFNSDSIVFPDIIGIIPLDRQVSIDVSDVDSSEWRHKALTYLAVGGEKYIYIGNNELNVDSSCIQVYDELSEIWNSSYILIDDLEVFEGTDCFLGELLPETDGKKVGFNELFSKKYSKFKFAVFDVLGRSLLEGDQLTVRAKLENVPTNYGVLIIVAYDNLNVLKLKYYKTNEN